ncbi:hypothetical protein M0805_007106 [Coniferiporia weirii]|nr:hypothetical protein M0805_007106 [Coniferiporia weirii]
MFSRPVASLSILPSTILALQRAGFQNVADLGTLSANQLSEELNIPAFLCEEILKAASATAPSLTRPAASLLNATRSSFPICKPIDGVLGGDGLKRGCILELSGPPGSPKERAVLDLVRSVAMRGEEIIFMDAQNMALPSVLKQNLKDIASALDLIHYVKCYSLPVLVAFLHNLPALLEQHPKVSLLVLNTLSFLFHTTPLPNASRTSLLERIKTMLSKVCASRHLTVAVTVQLATKMLGAEGSPANFDTAKIAVMVPQLGDGYLPPGRSYRVTFVPDSPTTGAVRLLASPSRPSVKLKANVIQEPYELVGDSLLASFLPSY